MIGRVANQRMQFQLYPRLLESQRAEHQPRLAALHQEMGRFYTMAAKAKYWEKSERQNHTWSPERHPAQWELKQLIGERDTVVDFGCGSAHPARNLGNPSRYTGVDWGGDQIARNRRTFPQAHFLDQTIYDTKLPADAFDWAISLFTLEHCVWPQQMLREMVRVVRPNGFVAVVCPQMRPGFMNSMWAGISARQSLRKKLRRGSLLDAIVHMIGQRLVAPFWIKRIDTPDKRFLIVEHPRCLSCDISDWASDTDAVYWADQSEIERELTRLGCTLLNLDGKMSWSGFAFCVARKRGDDPPSIASLSS